MLHRDEWLSNYFDGGAYAYQPIKNSEKSPKIKKGFLYAKIPSENLALCNQLIGEQYNLVDISLLFEQKTPVNFDAKKNLAVDFVKKIEEKEIIDIAYQSFIFSRFHQDTRIPKNVADQIKADWVKNYFLGLRGDNMIAAHVDGKVVGFLLLIHQNTIDLIAVLSGFQKQGIATALMGFANQKVGLLKAGTQLNNHGSMIMYQRSGFFLTQAHYVLHKFL